MQRLPGESLGSFHERGIAERLGISVEEVRDNMNRGCSCQWTDEFRSQMEIAIRRVGNDPSLTISPRLHVTCLKG